MLRFSFPHSHAFNGGQLGVDDDGKSSTGCIIEFADGVTVIGGVSLAKDNEYEIIVPEYTTSKGNTVAAHRWHIIKRQGESVWRSMAVHTDHPPLND